MRACQPCGIRRCAQPQRQRHSGFPALPGFNANALQELLALDNVSANERAALMCARWKFPYTYTLGKFMTEHLVNHYHQVHGLPLAVVRPRCEHQAEHHGEVVLDPASPASVAGCWDHLPLF
jgi:hypothetical protein